MDFVAVALVGTLALLCAGVGIAGECDINRLQRPQQNAPGNLHTNLVILWAGTTGMSTDSVPEGFETWAGRCS